MSAQETRRDSLLAQYMDKIQRMYTADSLRNMKEKIESAISQCNPYSELHELDYERQHKLQVKVEAALLKIEPTTKKEKEQLGPW